MLSIKQTKIPVVSVGNLILGGSGKTPFLLFLLKLFSSPPSLVLSRGYFAKKRKNKNFMIDPFSKISTEEVGDEMMMVHQRFPKVFLGIGKKRKKLLDLVFSQKKFLPKIVFLDDGLQARSLKKDFEIVLLNGMEFSTGYFPYGILRDEKKSLKRASLIVANDISSEKWPEFERTLKSYTHIPYIRTKPEIAGIFDEENQKIDPRKFSEKVALFCSIAHPKRFYELAKSILPSLVDSHFYYDHYAPSTEELCSLWKKAQVKEARFLLCTEKDFVKIPKEIFQNIPIYFLKIDLKVIEGAPHLDKLIEEIKKRI